VIPLDCEARGGRGQATAPQPSVSGKVGPWKRSESRERDSTAASRRQGASEVRANDYRQTARDLELLAGYLPAESLSVLASRLRIPDRRAVSAALIRAGKAGRGHAIRRCGGRVVSASVLTDGTGARAEGLQPVWCRDRLCPGCASRRAVRIGLELGKRLSELDTQRMVFATFTQPRIRGESLVCSRKRHAESWGALSRSSQWARKHWGGWVEGGVRAYEVTWDSRAGWHWHSHSVLMLRDGQSRAVVSGELLRQWCKVAPGASMSAQLIVPVDARRIWELAKYPVKPLESKGVLSPRVMAELIAGTRGARMIQPLGAWGPIAAGLDDDDDDDDDGKRVTLTGEPVRVALEHVERGRGGELVCSDRDGRCSVRVSWDATIKATLDKVNASKRLVERARVQRGLKA